MVWQTVEKKGRNKRGNVSSDVAPGICDKFEVDIFRIDKSFPGLKEHPMGWIVIDVCSTYMPVIPMVDNKAARIVPAPEEAFKDSL